MVTNLISAMAAMAARHSWTLRRRVVFPHRISLPAETVALEIDRGTGWDHLRWRRLDWMVRMFTVAHRLRPGGAIVDIGANIGQSLIAAREAAPDAPYLGFEPLPEEYAYVARMIARNGWTGARLFPLALSDRAATATLRVGIDRSTSSLDPASGDRHAAAGTIAVLTATGDEALARAGAGTIAIVKIDVEGHEPEVFAGLAETLRARMPPLLFEVRPPANARERRRADDVTRLLGGLGYRFGRCRLNGRVEWTESLTRELDPADPDDVRDINWLAVSRADAEAFAPSD